jgi:hypothetical protein
MWEPPLQIIYGNLLLLINQRSLLILRLIQMSRLITHILKILYSSCSLLLIGIIEFLSFNHISISLYSLFAILNSFLYLRFRFSFTLLFLTIFNLLFLKISSLIPIVIFLFLKLFPLNLAMRFLVKF